MFQFNQILISGYQQWKRFTNSGEACAGPGLVTRSKYAPNSSTGFLARTKCPLNSYMGPNTGKLKRNKYDESVLDYGPRCVACKSRLTNRRSLLQRNLHAEEGTPPNCQAKNCEQHRHTDAVFCIPHLLGAFAEWEKAPKENQMSINDVQSHIRRHQFDLGPALEGFLGVLEGDGAEAKAWCIDTEFEGAIGSVSQLLREVAVVDYHTGKVVLNVRVKHSKKAVEDRDRRLKDYSQRYGGASAIWQNLKSLKHRRTIIKDQDLEDVDVHELAKRMWEIGIRPDGVILEHSSSGCDHNMVRTLLTTNDHDGIMPHPDRCIPMVPIIKRNFPRGTSMKMGDIFPLLFPGSGLIGQNHRAAPDARMCQQVVKLVVKLSKPMTERDVGPYISPMEMSFRRAGARRFQEDRDLVQKGRRVEYSQQMQGRHFKSSHQMQGRRVWQEVEPQLQKVQTRLNFPLATKITADPWSYNHGQPLAESGTPEYDTTTEVNEEDKEEQRGKGRNEEREEMSGMAVEEEEEQEQEEKEEDDDDDDYSCEDEDEADDNDDEGEEEDDENKIFEDAGLPNLMDVPEIWAAYEDDADEGEDMSRIKIGEGEHGDDVTDESMIDPSLLGQ